MRASLVGFGLLLVFTSCKVSVDPGVHRYSCATTADCGDGWECRPQFAGGGLCFKDGVCTSVETCNGVDDNCDGRLDESFPEQGAACDTGLLGVCAAGTKQCAVGKIVCSATVQPSVERCNSLDDDCNGKVDDTFDLSTDSANCGSCGHACVTGTSCRGSVCRETTCNDAIDNDLNGLVDCADDSCRGYDCGAAVPSNHCGAFATDGGPAPDAGADAGVVRGCYPPEVSCSNGIDDDGDGLIDCQDPDCDGQTCMSGTVCANRTCPGPG